MFRHLLLGLLASASVAASAQMLVPDNLSVSATGAISYSIPIQGPPGIGTVVPSLSLSYNSQSGGGLLGLGWSLSGLSSIARCPQTVAQDPNVFVNGMVAFTTADRFCLDGKRLIAVNGAYGADGTEYRTEINSYTQVISHNVAGVTGGPGYFSVRTKTGLVLEYGNTASSRLMAVTSAGAVSTIAASWSIDSTRDRSGNYMTFAYLNDAANGTLYPQTISYTGNSTTGVTPGSAVTFQYQARPDVSTRYAAGYMTKSVQRMSKVVTTLGGVEVNEYQIGYAADQLAISRVGTITMCDNAGNCLPAKKFTSPNSTVTPNFSMSTTTATVTGHSVDGTANVLQGDFNGDGLGDIMTIASATSVDMKLSIGSSFNSVHATVPSPGLGTWRVVGNFDAGMQAEVLTLMNNKLYAYKWNGTTWTVLPGWNGIAAPSGCCTAGTTWVGDFNGDGLTDVATAIGSNSVHVMLTQLNGGYLETSQSASVVGANYIYLTGDFDGNGMTDIACIQGNTLTTLRASGLGGFTSATTTISGVSWPSTQLGIAEATFAADVNGDGRTDIVVVSDKIYVLFSTGTGYVQQSYPLPSPPGAHPAGQMWMQDMNGDGKADLVMTIGNMMYIDYFTGTGIQQVAFNTPVAWSTNSPAFMGDFDGDGLPDIAQIAGTEVTIALPVAFGYPGIVSGIDNGTGQVTRIQTQALTQMLGRNYVIEGSYAYPIVNVLSPVRVVTSVSHPNPGTTTPSVDMYQYHMALAQAGTGRGFLGFSKIVRQDGNSGLFTTTQYRQDFPYAGLVSDVFTGTDNGANYGNIGWTGHAYLCNSTVNSVGVDCTSRPANLTGAIYQLYRAGDSMKRNDLDGSPLPSTSVTYSAPDAYGNQATVTTSKTAAGSTYTTAETTTYYNDPANWLIGIPLKTVTTSTAPTLPQTVLPGSGNLPKPPSVGLTSILSIITSLLLSD